MAIEAIKNQRTIAQIASDYEVHPNQVSQWKRQILEESPQLFTNGRTQATSDNDRLIAELYRQIGELKVELDWVQKKLDCSVEQKRRLVDQESGSPSVLRQCELLGLPRASYYYQPAVESQENLLYMRLIDEQYTKTPFYGVPRMTDWLCSEGYVVNHKRIARLMRKMDLVAIYPKPSTSKNGNPSKKYPYLLKDASITRPDQVWATDITYIRLDTGFVYLVAIMDWYSRYVLSWELSNSLDVFFCLSALERALSCSSPLIFNSDQGAQFTSDAFTTRLESANIRISWAGAGRVFDNIFIERLWRTVKYENVYLHAYDSVHTAWCGLNNYFKFYNEERLHGSLNKRTPHEVYFQQH